MSHKISSSQERNLREQVEAVWPDAYDKLEFVSSFEDKSAARILFLILRFACGGQNEGGIVAGRNAFKRLPSDWLSAHLRDAISGAVNLKDEWEYLRLLELLEGSRMECLKEYVEMGIISDDPELREAALDFSKKQK